MKREGRYNILVLIAVCTALLTGCTPRVYLQLWQVTPVSEMTKDASHLTYQEDDCTVSYDFWNGGGCAGFEFYNNTDSIIYIDLAKSFYSLNGFAYDYYMNRRHIATTESAAAPPLPRGTDGAQMMAVPPHKSRYVNEYRVMNSRHEAVGLAVTPRRGESSSVSYDTSSTPYAFGNYITYSVGTGAQRTIENDFYVSRVTNMREGDVAALAAVPDWMCLRYYDPDAQSRSLVAMLSGVGLTFALVSVTTLLLLRNAGVH